MPILAALLLAATSPEPSIRSVKIGEGRYRILLSAPGLTLEQGQMAAIQEAARLCGGIPVTLGHYRWQSDEQMATSVGERAVIALRLEQEATCSAAPPPPIPRPTGWQPSDSDMKAVLDLTERYFAARDSGRYADAWSLFTPTMKDMSTLAQFQARIAGFNEMAGGALRRRPVAVTWYDNPPNAPVAGIFAAVDFVGEAKQLRFVCGYLIWLRQPDGGWRLTREEEGTMARADTSGSSPDQLARAKEAVGCRGPD
jgi:hypothetical protein